MKQRRSFFQVVRDRLTHTTNDVGVALIFVVGTMLILASLAVTAIAYTMAGEKFARYDQDHLAAMAAAQAGVEDYISRLNREDDYYNKIDCDNKALEGPMSVTNACGWNDSTAIGWFPVDTAKKGDKDGFFHYSVNPSGAQSEGTVALTVTGRVNGQYRTIEAAVGKGGSTDYVYYTDFEASDPSNKIAYPTTPAAVCGGSGYDAALYHWEGRPTSCSQAQFQAGDKLTGSVFSNDSVYAVGSTFTSTVSTADPACKAAVLGSESTWIKCFRSGSSAIQYSGYKPMYDTTRYMDDTSAAFADYPGCHYYGSTRVLFTADGNMTVWNKKASNGGQPPDAKGEVGGTVPSCGDIEKLDKPAGDTVAVPNNLVIYAAHAPASVPRKQCVAEQLGGPTGWTLPLGTYNGTIPAATATSSYSMDITMTQATKYCQSGNLYVEGILKGRTTVSAAQSVIVIGDTVLEGGLAGTDMLGLVATDSVEMFNPFINVISTERLCKTLSSNGKTCSTWYNTYEYRPDKGSLYNVRDVSKPATQWATVPLTGSSGWKNVTGWPRQFNDPTILSGSQVSGLQVMGSIQTLQHSFTVQNYNAGGPLGTLRVNGSIAQRWRGPVGLAGVGQPGYLKEYTYDTRLKYSAPPYFPRWVKSQWNQRYFGETEVDQDAKK